MDRTYNMIITRTNIRIRIRIIRIRFTALLTHGHLTRAAILLLKYKKHGKELKI